MNEDLLNWFLVTLGAIVAFILAFAIGANDVANAIGTSVGSRALTIRKASIIAGIFEFAGCATMGSLVSSTLKSDIVDLDSFQNELQLFVLGMFCALLASTIWLLIATWFGLPVSTTQTIVGGILAFGIVENGVGGVSYITLINIVVSWATSPLLGGIISFCLFWLIKHTVLMSSDPKERSFQLLPAYSSFTLGILSLFIISAQSSYLSQLNEWWAILSSFVGVCTITWILVYFVAVPYLRRREEGSLEVQALLISTDPEDSESVRIEKAPPLLEKLDASESSLFSSNTTSQTKIVNRSGRFKVSDNGFAKENDPKEQYQVDFLKESKGFQDAEEVHQHREKEKKEENAANDKDLELHKKLAAAERQFIILMIISAAFVAFAHGANDVANSVGPFAAILEYKITGDINPNSQIPIYLILFGGIGIVIGLITFGYRVIETIGEKITKLTFTRGYSAQLGTSTTGSFEIPTYTCSHFMVFLTE